LNDIYCLVFWRAEGYLRQNINLGCSKIPSDTSIQNVRPETSSIIPGIEEVVLVRFIWLVEIPGYGHDVESLEAGIKRLYAKAV
jgi:hypothetical protein